jgi:hypothetical protein
MTHLVLGAIGNVIVVLGASSFLSACDEGNQNATDAAEVTTTIAAVATDTEAERLLQHVMLTLDDVGGGYHQDIARPITNEQAAQARADTAAAGRQYQAWGQILSYNVQYSAQKVRNVINSPRPARIMHTATLYEDAGGATTAMVYLRALPVELLENILTNDGAGTRITDVEVQRGIAFATRGDESYAIRASGKATISGQLTVSFIADTVFVRSGRLNGIITTVALGSAPDRTMLESLVDSFVAKSKSV